MKTQRIRCAGLIAGAALYLFSADIAVMAGETPGRGADSLADVEDIYRFVLDGAEYRLPCEISEFEENGWTFCYYGDRSEVLPGSVVHKYWFCREGEGLDPLVILSLMSVSGDAAPAENCRVAGIEAASDFSSQPGYFSTAAGIALGDSREEVREAYGEEDRGEETCLEYVFNDYEGSNVSEVYSASAVAYNSDMLRFETGPDGKVTDISMAYYKVRSEDLTEPQRNPEIRGSYEKAGSLGDEIRDFTFSAGGACYRLPAPVSEFTANGWSFSHAGTIGGLREDITEMTRDDLTFSVCVRNAGQKAAAFEDAWVSEVQSGDHGELLLPGGISVGVSSEKLFALVPQWERLLPGTDGERNTAEEDGYIYSACSGSPAIFWLRDAAQTRELVISVEGDSVSSIRLKGNDPGE